MELSVVIAANNEADVLPDQLDALLAQGWDGEWEVLVADNGSTDKTTDVVARYHERDHRIRLVDASGRPGASYARNCGISAAAGKSLAFCDADDVVGPGWVAAMAEGLRRESSVAGKIRVDALNPEWLRTAYYTNTPDELEEFMGIFPFSATCNLGVRRSALTEVGGFDEEFLTGEDVEFCLRLWDAGYEMAYAPDAEVQYRYRASLGALWRRSRQYGAVVPAIAARLRELGHESPRATAGVRQWLWLVRKLPMLRTRTGRARWLVVAGTKFGRLEGSVRARRLVL